MRYNSISALDGLLVVISLHTTIDSCSGRIVIGIRMLSESMTGDAISALLLLTH